MKFSSDTKTIIVGGTSGIGRAVAFSPLKPSVSKHPKRNTK
jgi:short-subunit dehydrogenase involved in D-alanine esterification of teichoic acids